MIAEPTRTAKHTKTLINLILKNSAEKVIQSGVIGMELSDHWLIYRTRKAPLLKLNEHCKISKGKFPEYSNYTCVNDANQEFLTKILSVFDVVAPIRILRVKSNTKTWFDIDVLNATRNRDKQFRHFKQSGKQGN